MTLREKLNDALKELDSWQNSELHHKRSSIIHWASKISVLASQLAEETIKEIVGDMWMEEMQENTKDHEDES
jgi:hypothetical protein